MRVENIHLEPIIEYIKNNKQDEVILFGQYMELGNGGSATLEVGKNEEYVLPFLGELKQILIEYEDEFDKSPTLKEVITQFIIEKEETSNYPWIMLRWKDEIKTRSIDVKFSFNYMQQDYCLLQHYSNANIGMERMNYVTRYIVKSRELVNGEGAV